MKKLLVAIFAILYMGTSIGASVQMHYCMGKLADWSIGHKESKSCNKCGMEKSAIKSHDCCNDKQQFVKNTADQNSFETAFQVAQSIAVALPVSFYEIPSIDLLSITEANPISHAPPRLNGIAVYIRNCVFLI